LNVAAVLWEKIHMQTTTPAQGWHTAQWGTWGWLETIAKCIALVAAFIAVLSPFPASIFLLLGNPNLVALIVLILLTLASIAQLTIRLKQQETISTIFAVLNLLGHVVLLIAVALVPHHRLWPVLFGVFYVVGQLVKIQFLRITGYTEGGADSQGMLRTTAIIAVLYALFTVFMIPA
jgi:hypothetical protein